MKYTTVIFDLGNTLIAYWQRSEWPTVLEEAIAEVTGHLEERGLLKANVEGSPERVQAERGEGDGSDARNPDLQHQRLVHIHPRRCVDERPGGLVHLYRQ